MRWLFRNAVPLSLGAWLAFASFPQLFTENPFSVNFDAAIGNPDLVQFQALGGIIFIGVCLWVYRRRIRAVPFFHATQPGFLVLGLGIALLTLLAPYSTNPLLSFAYAVATGLALMAFSLFWFSDVSILRASWLAGLVTSFTFLIAGIAIYGLPEDRWVGGIHPNIYSTSAYAVVVFAHLLGRGSLRWLGLAAGLYFAYVVSSRYILFATSIFFFVYMVFDWREQMKLAGYIVRSALWTSLILGAVYFVNYPGLLVGGVEEVLQLVDEERGLGSGFTGRLELWKEGLDVIASNPWVGVGFRLGRELGATHNAFINLIVETGIITGGIILLGFVFIMFQQARNTWGQQGQPDDRNYFGRVALAASIGIYCGLVFQPQILNLGDTVGIVFLLCLTAHMGTSANPIAGAVERQHGN